MRIDPKTNKIANVIPVGRDPESIAYGGSTLWVYNVADRTVEGIDARTNAIAVTPTAIRGVAPIPSPLNHPIAADENGAWVLSAEPSGGGLLTHVRLDVPSTRELTLPDSPVSIAFGDGSIWVTTRSAATRALLRIDPRTGSIKRLSIPFDGTPSWIAVGKGGVLLTDSGQAYASPLARQDAARLYRVDSKAMRLTGSRSISCSGGYCETALGQGSVWVSESPTAGRPRLLRIDPGTLKVTRTIRAVRADLGPEFALDWRSIWWLSSTIDSTLSDVSGAVRVESETRKITATIPIRLTGYPGLFAAAPSAITPGGGSIWTSMAGAPR